MISLILFFSFNFKEKCQNCNYIIYYFFFLNILFLFSKRIDKLIFNFLLYLEYIILFTIKILT